MSLTTDTLILIALSVVVAIVSAALPYVLPDAAHSPMLHEITKQTLFVFMIGAGAVIYRALG